MKTSTRNVLIFFTIAASVIAASQVAARPGGKGHGMGGELFRTEMLAAKLSLNESQRDQLYEIADSARETIRPHVREMMLHREDMLALAQADSFDEAAVRRLATAQSAAMVEMMVAKLRKKHQIWQILDDRQRQEFEALMARHRP